MPGTKLLSISLLAVFLIVGGATKLLAMEIWTVSPQRASTVPRTIVEETRRPAPDGLPDGLVATHAGNGDIVSAWYAGPTTRYGHGILGDAIEASALVIKTRGGKVLSLALPDTEVFEDRYPRLADLDGDGRIEVVTIRSSVSHGGSVTVYGLRGNQLGQQASTGFIGLANRWLNIAGVARFRGKTGKEIAYVRTPHIGGTLFLYEYANGVLNRVAALDGFSNHVIGSTEMRLSAVADINGDGRMDLALPSDDRRTLRIVGFNNNVLTDLASARLPGPIDKAIAVEGTSLAPRFIVGLQNGDVYAVHR